MDKETTMRWYSRVDEIMTEIHDLIIDDAGDNSEWECGWNEGAGYGWLKLHALRSEMRRAVDESDQ